LTHDHREKRNGRDFSAGKVFRLESLTGRNAMSLLIIEKSIIRKPSSMPSIFHDELRAEASVGGIARIRLAIAAAPSS
jgi:hypothetical protein